MRGGGAMRLKGFVKKETLQIIRDPSSIAIAFVLPIILLLIFGYGVSLDAKRIPIAVVVEKPGPETNQFIAGFRRSEYFIPKHMRTIQEAMKAMKKAQVNGVVWLRENFAREYHRKDSPPISLLVNGVDANTAKIIEGYVQGVWLNWLEQHGLQNGIHLKIPVQVEYRIWYNPEVRSRNYLVPGIIAVIMTLIGALLTALVIAREWERGTMEAMLVTPITAREIILGKIIPYFILGMGGFMLSFLVSIFLFNVPMRGSFLLLLGSSSLFLLASLGMGLLISTLAKSQFVAAQISIVVTFLPAFILSGFIFEISSMPWPIQAITHLIPARYYVSILQSAFLAGDIWKIFIPNAVALILMTVFFIGIIHKKIRKRLD